jgi:hypothetical protein
MLEELQRRADARWLVMPDSLGKRGHRKMTKFNAIWARDDNLPWVLRIPNVLPPSDPDSRGKFVGVNSNFT